MKVPFSPPDISQAEIDNVIEVLKSGWITTGPKTKELERRIATYCGVEKSVCLNSQTACAEMALRVLEIGAGDEVITTAYTYTATASVICHVGATPILIDTNGVDLQMDYNALSNAINEKTKAVIVVDIAGIPCDYDKVFEIVKAKQHLFKANSKLQSKLNRVAVISDSAHSFGAEYKGKKAGSIADFSAFSFHAVKNLTTAEGGALTWGKNLKDESEEIYKRVQLLSLHGQSKDALAKTKAGAWEYDVVGAFYKCNMTDIMAGIGLAQLDRYEGMLKRRKEIIQKYDSALKPLGVELLNHYGDNYSSSGHLYIVRVPFINSNQRNEIITKMGEREIGCNVHYKPLPLLTAYKNMGFDISNYPNAYARFEKSITLPLNTLMTDEQVDFVIDNFLEILGEYNAN
ncbi:MAG: DegT/DnrJ/EryC1/StrS aminotransferase family protein [Clostridia bacterium]|nr:DegT/DnrJ/EryC1/StrS aminotransferase family protein [Clostridia bacterium]